MLPSSGVCASASVYDEDPQIICESYSPEDIMFDQVVCSLQEIVMESEFAALQESFIKKHCMVFECEQENKMQYMSIYSSYQEEVQNHFQQEMLKRDPEFDLSQFEQLASERSDQIDESLLQIIKSFTDFQTFKEMMLSYKAFISSPAEFKSLFIKGSSAINFD